MSVSRLRVLPMTALLTVLCVAEYSSVLAGLCLASSSRSRRNSTEPLRAAPDMTVSLARLLRSVTICSRM